MWVISTCAQQQQCRMQPVLYAPQGVEKDISSVKMMPLTWCRCKVARKRHELFIETINQYIYKYIYILHFASQFWDKVNCINVIRKLSIAYK